MKDTPSKSYVVLAVPSEDTWHADTVVSVVHAAAILQASGVRTRINNVRNSQISAARNSIVKNALECGATHVMWIDSDMRFDANIPMRLLAHGKSIVGCTYRKRRPDYRFLHQDFTGGSTDALRLVARLPGGMLLVDTDVYRDLGSGWYDELPGVGEDYAFCDRARHILCTIWLDEYLSRGVSHVGQMRATFDMPRAVVDWLNSTQA